MHWLSLLMVVPVGAALGAAFVRDPKAARAMALTAALVTLAIAAGLYADYFGKERRHFAYVEDVHWMSLGGLEIRYHLGVDGVSLSMVVLTALLTVVAMLSQWNSIHDRMAGFFITFLALEAGTLGVFMALDLFLFYVFWEAALIPMYLVIGIWGGPRRIYASLKFVLFTVLGSLFMLVAILYVGMKAHTFDVWTLTYVLRDRLVAGEQILPFAAFALAFLIKVPAVPFHTWLPDAHVEAPTAGSVILAGVLLKLGVYGLLRFAIPFFPDAARQFGPGLMILGTVGIVYGALMAMAQSDIKKMIAYSSVSHMGVCVLGLFAFQAAAAQGAVMQMINHGLSTGALFMLVGVIYDRTHKRGVDDFGGLAKVTPLYAAVFLVVTLSSIGLPGLNGFIGEVLVLFGTFQSGGAFGKICAAVAGTGVILGAVYMLRLYRDVFFGPVRLARHESLADLEPIEVAMFVPLVALFVVIGLQPSVVLSITDEAANLLVWAAR